MEVQKLISLVHMEDTYHTLPRSHYHDMSYHQQSCGAGAGHDTSGLPIPQRDFFGGLYDCVKLVVSRQIAAVPSGTGSHTRMILWWIHSRSFCNVGGSRLKLSEVGFKTGMSGFVVQM